MLYDVTHGGGVGRCVGGGVGLCVRTSHNVSKKHTAYEGWNIVSTTKIDIRCISFPNNTYLSGLTLTHGAFSLGGTVLVARGTSIVKRDPAKPVICCARDEYREIRGDELAMSNKVGL